jgi:Protein of unknown function (DUF3102)/ParB-like nuclease domain
MSGPGDNRLAVLAEEIRSLHAKVKLGAQQLATDAIEAGQRLVEVKEQSPHGQWLPWLRANCGFSDRTARRYMQLAESNLKLATVAILGIRGASEAIAKRSAPRPAADAEPAPDYDFGIPISDIIFNRDLYPRLQFDLEYVRELAGRLDLLPPIEVNQHNVLIDGRYRLEAHKACGMRRIRVVVTEVADAREHLCLSIKRNSRHGVPLTNEQCRDAIADVERMENATPAARVFAHDGKLTYLWPSSTPGFTCFSVIDPNSGEVIETRRGVRDDRLNEVLLHAGFDIIAAGAGTPLSQDECLETATGLGIIQSADGGAA